MSSNINRDQRHGQEGAIGNPNIKSQLYHPLLWCCNTTRYTDAWRCPAHATAKTSLSRATVAIYGTMVAAARNEHAVACAGDHQVGYA